MQTEGEALFDVGGVVVEISCLYQVIGGWYRLAALSPLGANTNCYSMFWRGSSNGGHPPCY